MTKIVGLGFSKLVESWGLGSVPFGDHAAPCQVTMYVSACIRNQSTITQKPYGERAHFCVPVSVNPPRLWCVYTYGYTYTRNNIASSTTIELDNMAEDEEEEGLNVPLIDDRHLAHDDGRDNGVSHHENGTSSLNAFIWALTFTAGISGLLFGYECVAPFPFQVLCLHNTKRNRS